MSSNATPSSTNRLIGEKSPYLLQHAHNPVDWYPWGPDALELARQQDKPIFLSVGYSACHWCHVMERESFENEAIAQLLNDNFVSIKVDREERPDVDEIYMTAVQMMTGHGGWPMSVFMTPDGRPFYGGTYFPPQSVRGRIGFPDLITQLAEAWHSRRDEVERVASEIVEDLERATRQRPVHSEAGALDPVALRERAVADLAERFDMANGGFGGAPKFPPHHALRLLADAARAGDPDAPRLLTTTLDKMALGGIYDHIGGGFHRYATDAIWLLPHFEKMLYDNALLARVYADAYDLTGRSAYARIARETCDWVLRDMTDAASGFHAALDADSEGEEGKYYVWTPDQITNALGADAGKQFSSRYHVRPGGNFRDEATGHQSDASIPYLAVGASDTVLPDELEPIVLTSRNTLRALRDTRIPPAKDDKVITAWNGLMIGALALAGKVLNQSDYLAAAKRAAQFALTTLRPGGNLVRRFAKGEAGLPAFLDDYAYLADGLLDLHDATGDLHWRDAAAQFADTLLERFWDTEDGGFFFAGTGHEQLIARSKDLFDGALPSANGVAARVLVRLGASSTADAHRFADAARALLVAYRGVLERAPNGTHTLIGAAQEAFPANETASSAPILLSSPEPLMIRAGESGTLTFTLHVAPGFHIEIGSPHKLTTSVQFNVPAAVGPVHLPPATQFSVAGDRLMVYTGAVPLAVPVQVGASEPGAYHVTLTVRCEPCTDNECLPATEITATATVEIT